MQTQMIEFAANGVAAEGSTAPGYLAQPDAPAPAVVVVQEWWGLTDHVKDVTRRFAEAGYAALAPDFYRGEVAAEPDEARKLAMELQYPQVQADVQGAIDYLLAQPFVEPKQVGVIGFCMGGRLASRLAMTAHNLSAAVAFYGVPALSKEDAAAFRVPLLAIYGENDAGFPPELIRANREKLKAAGVTHEVVVYPGARHAFFNNSRPHIYQAAAAQDAWRRTLDWFEKYLKA